MFWLCSAVFWPLKIYLLFCNYICKCTFSWLRLSASLVMTLPGHLQIWGLYNAGFFAWETIFQEPSQRYHLGTEAESSKAEKSQQFICYKKPKECHGDFFSLLDFSFTSSKVPQACVHPLWMKRCREVSGRLYSLKRRDGIPYRSINFLVTELVWAEYCSPQRLKLSAPTYILKITNENSCWK